MRTEEQDSQGVHSELIARLFGRAELLSRSHQAVSWYPVIANWWFREAHLAVERAAASVEAGAPPETAWFLAADDPGFQLALAAANEYYTAR